MTLLLVALGGAGGSLLRYLLGGSVQRASGTGFPIGTLFVNVAGCFLAGVLVRHFMNIEGSAHLRAALLVGFCGGFTTFSTFSVETVGLIEGGEYGRAAAYSLLSFSLCLGATFAGVALLTRPISVR